MKKIACDDIEAIVDVLNQDKVIAIPTDTIYGFSCLATSETAVKKIYELKRRSEQKSFIILVSKSYDLNKIVKDKNLISFIRNNTPAPLTMIVNKSDDLKLSSSFYLPTIAIRIPDDDFLQKILAKVGYMVSTSCNIQGEPNINNFVSIEETFTSLDAIVELEEKQDTKPSTIVDLTSSPIKILRQGDYVLK